MCDRSRRESTTAFPVLAISRADVLSLQNRGYYLTRSGELLSNEGELQARTNEGILYTLRFGEILYGSGEAISAGADGSSDESSGPGENRYLFITAEFDPTALPEPPKPANTDFEGKEESGLSDADKENKKLAGDYKKWEENVAKGQEKGGSALEAVRPLVLRDRLRQLRQDPPTAKRPVEEAGRDLSSADFVPPPPGTRSERSEPTAAG